MHPLDCTIKKPQIYLTLKQNQNNNYKSYTTIDIIQVEYFNFDCTCSNDDSQLFILLTHTHYYKTRIVHPFRRNKAFVQC